MTRADEPRLTCVLGVAREAVNPPEGAPLIGYPNERPNEGVGLDLMLRAMLFGTPGAPAPAAALVVVDNLGMEPGVIAALRAAAAGAVPGLEPARVMVAATHTHSAPSLSTRTKKGDETIRPPEPSYVAHVEKACAAAAARAWADRAEVAVRIGRAEARLGHNRRVVDDAGTATNVWLDLEARHTGYFNPAIRFTVFEAPGGGVRALLSGYGCHPVTLGPGNLRCHADYPGYLTRELEARTGARLAVHVTSGGADINPRDALHPTDERARAMGEHIAAKILAALPAAAPVCARPIAVASETVEFVMSASARQTVRLRAVESGGVAVVRAEVQAIRLGDMAFVSAPGELFSQIAVTVENTSPLEHTIVVGYGNDYLGYLFTDTARREGGYEPRSPVSESIERPFLAAARLALEKTVA